MIITIPRIDIPVIVRGNTGTGIGRGEGNEGDVIGKDDDGNGSSAGQGHGDGIDISVDLEEVLKLLQEELELPDLKPKPNQVYEEIKIKYNDISLVGVESLLHKRRTLLQTLKRQCCDGTIHDLHDIPGFSHPIPMLRPINSDKRYRQFREIRIPASNAVIFFARDGSGSMDQLKCDIVSDMAWWIDSWIRRYYKRVERCYVWHDTIAEEVDENKFYRHRYGGGTTCSSALKFISKQLENRFPPQKWNVYIFYFSDGENWGNDNKTFCQCIEDFFPPTVVNLVGITQVLSYQHHYSLIEHVDNFLANRKIKNVRTTEITSQSNTYPRQITDEERDKQVKRAIIDLLGKEKVKK